MELGDKDLPAIYRNADQRSVAAQRHVLRALKLSLVGVIVAAGFGAASFPSGSVDWAGVAASTAFLVATLSTAWMLWAKPEQDWYDARAVAESAKTLTWQYAVGGGEFIRTEVEDAARTRFLARLRELLDGLERLHPSPSQEDSPVSARLEALRSSSLEERRDAYLENRISDQCTWYTEKAQWNESRRIAWTTITIVLLGAGLIFGVAKAFFELDADMIGPAAAAAGSALAWARSKDYAELAAAYAVTAEELRLIEAEPPPREEQTWAAFVERAERAISREHTLWKARRGAPRMGP
ncbi:MAG: DUF4231 domain-containing protein [Thermoleophilia bacterium]